MPSVIFVAFNVFLYQTAADSFSQSCACTATSSAGRCCYFGRFQYCNRLKIYCFEVPEYLCPCWFQIASQRFKICGVRDSRFTHIPHRCKYPSYRVLLLFGTRFTESRTRPALNFSFYRPPSDSKPLVISRFSHGSLIFVGGRFSILGSCLRKLPSSSSSREPLDFHSYFPLTSTLQDTRISSEFHTPARKEVNQTLQMGENILTSFSTRHFQHNPGQFSTDYMCITRAHMSMSASIESGFLTKSLPPAFQDAQMFFKIPNQYPHAYVWLVEITFSYLETDSL